MNISERVSLKSICSDDILCVRVRPVFYSTSKAQLHSLVTLFFLTFVSLKIRIDC